MRISLFRTCFIFRNPQPKEIKIIEILHPFSIKSWYLMLVFLVIFFFIASLTFRYEAELSHSIYSNSFLMVSGALCQQSKILITAKTNYYKEINNSMILNLTRHQLLHGPSVHPHSFPFFDDIQYTNVQLLLSEYCLSPAEWADI